MGCDETREDIEEKIVYTTLERDQIRKERKLLLDQLRLITGEEIEYEPIPDYIDIEHIKKQKRKRIQKQIKQAVEEEEERQKEAGIKQRKLEEEIKRLEKFGYDEEFLYQPLSLKVNNKKSEIDDIYDLNYVLEKKDKKTEQKNDDEEINEDLKENTNKKKSILKNKKVKFNVADNNEDEDEDNNDDIDNDIIQKVDAKIASKTGSIASALGEGKNKKSKKNSNADEDSIPYYTPHLQPND